MDERQQKEQALRDAAGNGDTNRVNQLIEEGVNPDAHTDDLFTLQKTPLHLAAENGHHETVSALLTAGVEVDAWDRLEMTPLHLAAEHGHHETVTTLLTAGADVNVQDWQHRTPLHLAAEEACHHETVSALLAAGADVNARNKWQKTPLHLAAGIGHHETISALLAAGADVKVSDGQRKTPLHLAAEKGNHETVSALLTAGADANVRDSGQKTPLHLAAEKGHRETVSALLAAGADVNARDSWKRTTLHWAAQNGHHKTVSVLLAADADVNAQDYEQRTPLHLVAQSGHHETVPVLLTAGADVNVRDKWQKTLLHLAAENDQLKTVTALLAAGADVNVQDRQQRTPLHLAAEKGHHETVSALLAAGADAGADVNVQDRQQRTPLHLAAEKGHHETVSALLAAGADAGADVNVQDRQQRTPLHLAAEGGHPKTVSALLADGADVNAQDSEGRTPLHLAAENGHHETVSALLAAGADVNAWNKLKRTPLHQAVMCYHPFSALLAAGADVDLQDDEQKIPLHLADTVSPHKIVSALLAAGAHVNVQDWQQRTPLHLAVENGHHETVSALLAAGADVNVQDNEQKTPLHLAAIKLSDRTASLTAGERTPQHLAVEKGPHETVSALLAAGANVNVRDCQQRTSLHLAAEKGHHETVSALLRDGADVNVQDRQQRTPLHLAAEKGHYETVSALLSLAAGADVNVRDNQQRTPLHLAVEKDHHGIVSSLLTAGADVNVQDNDQMTPLHLAAEKGHHKGTHQHRAAWMGHYKMVSLLAAGADVNVRDSQHDTPLHLAVEKGYHKTVSALLAAGAYVNVRDRQQRTPLHLAVQNGDHETVSALLAAGAEVNVQDGQQKTPLHLAAKKGHHETVSALLAAGADANVQDIQQRTPLHLGLEVRRGHHETVSALLTAGADVNVLDSLQKTPLLLAAEKGHRETVKALLAAGADVNTRGSEQKTPLHLAAEKGHHKIVSVLLTAGADVNVQDSQQMTPLHLAAVKDHHLGTDRQLAVWMGHCRMVSALLAAGADVNVQDRQQRTPLHLAVLNDNLETVSDLLAAGADVNVQDRQGFTPLQYATEKRHSKCVEVLLQHKADKDGQKKVLATILSRLEETDVRLLMQVWSARTGKQESPGAGAEVTADFMKDLMETEYITTGDQGMLQLEKDMIAAGISLPAIVRDFADGQRHPHLSSLQPTEPHRRRHGGHRTREARIRQDRRPHTTTEYITTGDQGMLQLEKDMIAAGISLPAIVRDFADGQRHPHLSSLQPTEPHRRRHGGHRTREARIRQDRRPHTTTATSQRIVLDTPAPNTPPRRTEPGIAGNYQGVPEELKYTRTIEAAVGPAGGELEIPGFVKLIVPPGVLQQDTVITISTVDVAAILRDPDSVNWISGYPWSLGEDACPRELLDQVLFSPAVDVNLHGAVLNGDLEVQTWRPPGSEGMKCLLLKHHDGEGWTDITASTEYQVYSDKISTFLQTFSPLTILWAPVDTLITVGKMVVAALSSRTLNCQFAGYIKPHTDGVEFHVVCRDRSVKTDDYQPDFTLCGRNKAMFDLYNGSLVDVTVSILQGQERSRLMKLRAQQCCEDEGQSVQMLLDRPNGKPVKGDVTINNIQERPPQTVCEFIFWECQEGDILTTKTTCVNQGAGNTHKMQTYPKRLQPQTAPTDHDIRADSSATAVAWCIPIVVELKPPWRELGRNLGLSESDTERISQRHQDDTGRCCLAVLEEWLHLSGTNATVEGLKTSLGLAGQREIVEKLNTMEQSMRGKLLELQSEVTDIVHPNFPNLNFVPDKNKEADERRIELNRRTLREEVFSNSFNFSLDSVILDRIQERKKSVCRINWPGGSGTGFLLSKGKVLTCYHVYRLMNRALWSVHEASQYTATFFVSTGREHKVPFESPAALLKCYSEDLDYAILQLSVEDEMERHLESLPLLAHFISESEDSRKMVVLVGHPSGGNKIVDFGCIAGVVRRYIVHVRFPNMIQEDERKPLYNTSVMFHGSSGSPGFDTYGNVVLMHTRGFPDASSKSLIERGVRLSAIRDHARQNLAPGVFNEIFPATSEQVAVPLASLSVSSN
ncbi:uncharacterized protein LOC144865784 isoform X2 [Branchiostoma floridae x Branchiostoma japonicum]